MNEGFFYITFTDYSSGVFIFILPHINSIGDAERDVGAALALGKL